MLKQNTAHKSTINKWNKLYKGILQKRRFEQKLWLEKEKNKILTESLDNYLRFIREYQIEAAQFYQT